MWPDPRKKIGESVPLKVSVDFLIKGLFTTVVLGTLVHSNLPFPLAEVP